VLAAAAALFVILRYLERSGILRRVHRVSQRRKFALELRTNLVILFALAALATRTHVSVMLAGFSFGLAMAAVGQPRRLAKQLFAITEGFLGPLFFVWLGASLDLRELGRHPSLIGLGLALGAGAVATHAAMRLTGQPIAIATLTCAQLGYRWRRPPSDRSWGSWSPVSRPRCSSGRW
jgi:Kef-type K+ transport system membrane component KefB